MISKELLKNVLYGENIDNILIISNDVTFEYSHYVNGVFQYRRKTDINIYELAHKCKEWALNLGYILYSTVHGYECYIDSRNFINNTPVRFLAESEPEAVFKACQWILDKDSK